MRDRYREIVDTGAEIVVVGTGNADLARAFIEDDGIPYPVLLDDGAVAANVASLPRVNILKLFDPVTYPGTLATWRRGYRVGRPGPRVNQLGATFVMGPGDSLRYEYRDAHSADHAPMQEIFATLTEDRANG